MLKLQKIILIVIVSIAPFASSEPAKKLNDDEVAKVLIQESIEPY